MTPFSNAMAFQGAQPAEEMRRSFSQAEVARVTAALKDGGGDRNTCRWCFEKFEVERQERSIRERGSLRTNLMMADNGTELVCCDTCWSGAAGLKIVQHGRMIPCMNPNEIPNPLLRPRA